MFLFVSKIIIILFIFNIIAYDQTIGSCEARNLSLAIFFNHRLGHFWAFSKKVNQKMLIIIEHWLVLQINLSCFRRDCY